MTAPMTPDREQDIRAREQAATPGPWGTSRDLNGIYTIKHGTRITLQAGFDSDGDVAVLAGDDETAYRNSEFITRARQDIPDLLAEIDRLRAEVDKVQRQHTYDTAELKREADDLRSQVAALSTRPVIDDVAAWLVKKAREYRGVPSRVESASDAPARMADEVSRGAIRPAKQAPEATR